MIVTILIVVLFKKTLAKLILITFLCNDLCQSAVINH